MTRNSTKDIVMVLSNPFKPDYRVYKEAKSLSKHGYNVTIVAWDRDCRYPDFEDIEGIKIERIKVKAPYGTGLLKLNRMLLFWLKAVISIKQKKCAGIHCHDLDTLIIGIFFKFVYRVKLIYDSHEYFPGMIQMSSPLFVASIIKIYESCLLYFVDSIIVASSILGEEFKQKIDKPVTVIGNWHYKPVLDLDIVKEIRNRYLKNAKIMIVYIGGLDLSRAILPMIEATKLEPSVNFLICGNGTQRKAIINAASDANNIMYIGEIPLKMVPYYTAAADVIYYVMNNFSPIANYNAPNSLGFSLIIGKPLIASNNGELGKVIRETNCGILVKNSTVDTLRGAIRSLQAENRICKLGRNALKAGHNSYNWIQMEALLVNTYNNLIKG